jgi:WD40 repeat protein
MRSVLRHLLFALPFLGLACSAKAPDTGEPGRYTVIRSIAFSPKDPRLIAVGARVHVGPDKDGGSKEQGATLVFSLPAKEPRHTFYPRRGPTPDYSHDIDAVAFSPDGSLLAASCANTTIDIWEVATGKHVAMLTEHEGFPVSVAFSPDRATLASAGSRGKLILWDVKKWRPRRVREVPDYPLRTLAYGPDGHFLVVGKSDGFFEVCDGRTGEREKVLWADTDGPAGSMRINRVAFSPDAKRLALGGSDEVQLWTVPGFKREATLKVKGHPYPEVRDVAFSPDGKVLAAGVEGGAIHLWDLKTKKQTLVIPIEIEP